MGVIPFVDVTQPRDDMDAREGFLFFKFFDINCN
jgi:hypothetical protein